MRVILRIPFIGFLLLFGAAIWFNIQHLENNHWNWPAPFMSKEQLIEYDEWLLKQKAMERQREIDQSTEEARRIIEEDRNITKEQTTAAEEALGTNPAIEALRRKRAAEEEAKKKGQNQ